MNFMRMKHVGAFSLPLKKCTETQAMLEIENYNLTQANGCGVRNRIIPPIKLQYESEV